MELERTIEETFGKIGKIAAITLTPVLRSIGEFARSITTPEESFRRIAAKYLPSLNVIGAYETDGFNVQGNIILPNEVMEFLNRRAKIREDDLKTLYFRPHLRESPQYFELSDKPELKNDMHYIPVTLNEQCKLALPSDIFEKSGKKYYGLVVFEVSGNEIRIFSKENYKAYSDISYMSIDVVRNLGARMFEFFNRKNSLMY